MIDKHGACSLVSFKTDRTVGRRHQARHALRTVRTLMLLAGTRPALHGCAHLSRHPAVSPAVRKHRSLEAGAGGVRGTEKESARRGALEHVHAAVRARR